jgi:8-oxo-dGTP pyrophosphatase MutT (NUDIX family)
MPSRPSPTWAIALVVVRDEDRFVLVNESRERGWYLPAGRVEHGETLMHGAVREVREEAGLEVELDGIIRIEHTPALGQLDARLRIVFVAHAIGGALKTEPDDESLGAEWVRLCDLVHYRLRSPEVARHLEYVASGGIMAPLALLTAEGAPYSPALRLHGALQG